MINEKPMFQNRTYHNIFLRLDDVGRFEKSVIQFGEKLEELQIPWSAAVVPDWLNREAAYYLKKWEYCTVLQHGRNHINNVSKGYPDEFPDSIPYKQVLSDIKAGKDLLEDTLGEMIWVYVPPWNCASKNTFKVLMDLGFLAISGHRKFCRQEPLSSIDVSIDTAPSYFPLKMKPQQQIIMEVQKASSSGKTTVGVMYHLTETSLFKISQSISTIKYLNKVYRIIHINRGIKNVG